ncbi:MAG TPA: tRNA (N6-threonylcarbamoyladenosine(37)-N6)-methyltransferase TrmO [Williamwhitmania sp.]|nr:tRNA (N6-threonylcarbamoyladenosine(37)-N6)-methyltransferase TrmO [Williamwhitmania sp.]
MEIKFESIGTIHTPFKTGEGMPIQSVSAEGVKGTIELKQELVDGLLDLDGFSHIMLLYQFHKSTGYSLHTKPFIQETPHGVFATRAPQRPNSIGLSVVKLISISGNVLEIENVDMLDGTPLLDIKPYISQFDIHKTEKNGWFEKTRVNLKEVKSDDRFM